MGRPSASSTVTATLTSEVWDEKTGGPCAAPAEAATSPAVSATAATHGESERAPTYFGESAVSVAFGVLR